MTEDINKGYVQKYINQAKSTNNEDLKNNALYRVGTQMELIPCDGNANLTQEQQKKVCDAASLFLGEKTED